jgi:hypothetical protein
MTRLGLLIALPAFAVRLMLLIRGQPVQSMPLQDAMHGGTGDLYRNESALIRGNAGRAKVIVLAEIENLADHLASCRSRRSVRRPWPIAQATVTVLGVPPFPLVERLPGNPESTADPCDILLVCRLP